MRRPRRNRLEEIVDMELIQERIKRFELEKAALNRVKASIEEREARLHAIECRQFKK